MVTCVVLHSQVTSPYGNNIHYADRVEFGTFSFTSKEDGDYMTCFWAHDHKPAVTLTVDFDWKSGIAAKDWSNVAKKDQLDVRKLLSFFQFTFYYA